MSAATDVMAPVRPPSRLLWLRREFAPTPGRAAMTLRLVLGVVAVVVISMTLQTPSTAISAYMVFFVTKENRVVTTITGIGLAVGATLGVAASILLSTYTYDAAYLRVPFMAVT